MDFVHLVREIGHRLLGWSTQRWIMRWSRTGAYPGDVINGGSCAGVEKDCVLLARGSRTWGFSPARQTR
jgi:hypothetical protein